MAFSNMEDWQDMGVIFGLVGGSGMVVRGQSCHPYHIHVVGGVHSLWSSTNHA
jgi:hypothetical protein